MPEVALPAWPQLSQVDFDALQPRIETRFEAVTANLIASKAPKSLFMRFALKVLLLNKKEDILDFIKLSILSDLVRRDQIQGWALPNPWKNPIVPMPEETDIRKVWAELLNPSWDFCTADGIAFATKLDPTTVQNILAMSQAESGQPYSVWCASWAEEQKDKSAPKKSLYVLVSRKPGLLGRLPITRNIGNWWSAPSINDAQQPA